MWFLILSVVSFEVSEVSMVLIDLWNIIETNYLVFVDDTWEYNGASLRLCPESLRRCRRRRVDVIIGRLEGMVQGNGVLEVNGSLSRLRSPLRLGSRQAGLPFLSFLSRVSLSWPIPLPTRPSPHLFLFRFHAVTPEKLLFPVGFLLAEINTSLIPSCEYRDRE